MLILKIPKTILHAVGVFDIFNDTRKNKLQS